VANRGGARNEGVGSSRQGLRFGDVVCWVGGFGGLVASALARGDGDGTGRQCGNDLSAVSLGHWADGLGGVCRNGVGVVWRVRGQRAVTCRIRVGMMGALRGRRGRSRGGVSASRVGLVCMMIVSGPLEAIGSSSAKESYDDSGEGSHISWLLVCCGVGDGYVFSAWGLGSIVGRLKAQAKDDVVDLGTNAVWLEQRNSEGG
jgi:hypothetical protein